MHALSIQQPWAWLIANGHKDVENRTWPTNFRRTFLIHAGKKFDLNGYQAVQQLIATKNLPIVLPARSAFDLGGIVGAAEVHGCVTHHQSLWFFGPYGFLIRNAEPLPFEPMRGQLNFFQVKT